MTQEPAYGLWSLVVINSLVFIIFAFSFTKPRTNRDWRSFSAFSAFIIALFVEMYGFPLTIYLLSGWLVRKYPGVDFFSHDAGHLWNTLVGWKMNPHFDPLHILSNILILCGFILLSAAWKVLYEAQRTESCRERSIWLRAPPAVQWFHPHHVRLFTSVADLGDIDYVSILVTMYVRLARREGRRSQRSLAISIAAMLPGLLRSCRMHVP